MYGPSASGIPYPYFIEIASTADILVLGGLPSPSNLTEHDVIPCFPTEEMAEDYIQRSIDDGNTSALGWVVVTYPNDAVGRAKVAATQVTHFAAVLRVHPFDSHACLTAGV